MKDFDGKTVGWDNGKTVQGSTGEMNGIFADFMTCLKKLRKDMTKRIDRVDERAQFGP